MIENIHSYDNTYNNFDVVDDHSIISDMDLNIQVQELKYFLFLTTHNHYSDDECKYIIKEKLLEY